MGACNFIEFKAAGNVKEAFLELVSEAEWEHGHDPYNGTISTTGLRSGYKRIADEWSEEAREKAIAAAEEDDWGEKWESRALYCGKCGEGIMWAFYGWASC